MMKKEILEILRNSRAPVSGQKLCDHFQISRVGIWKHVQGLIKLGYKISSSSRGYLLEEERDILMPWEFEGLEDLVCCKDVVDSTMDWARELLLSGQRDSRILIAGTQTRGRGRLHRPWLSRTGGLYFTLVLFPRIPLHLCYLYNFAAVIALSEVLQELFGIRGQIKWPNDLLVEEKKVAGILLEVNAEGGIVNWLNLGIGVNVNNIPGRELQGQASSLIELAGRPFSRKELLLAFWKRFEKLTGPLDREGLVRRFRSLSLTFGRQVEVRLSDSRVLRGRAAGIDETGALLLETGDGEIKQVHYGDCSLIPG